MKIKSKKYSLKKNFTETIISIKTSEQFSMRENFNYKDITVI